MDTPLILIDVQVAAAMVALFALVLVWLCFWSPGGPRWQAAKRLARSEDGAAYTLAYVMVVPIYAWLICLIAESVMMMTAKLGTQYAAFAGARAASVWASSTDWTKAQEHIQRAATIAFVPFASGTQALSPLDVSKAATILGNRRAVLFQTAYKEFSSDSASLKYMSKKFLQSHLALQVSVKGPPAAWNSDLEVKVVYRYPFQVPGIGRLLGKRGPDNRFYYPLTTTAILPNEGPQNTKQTLGIGYGTF